MTCIADANVLFALLVDGHVAQNSAQRWWEEQADETVGWHLLTRLAVLRLLTNRVSMNGAPVAPGAAMNAWQQLAEDPRCFAVEATPPSHEAKFAALVSGRAPTPNLWTDAWLAALAQSLDCELVTFDRGFQSFHTLRLSLLTVSS